MDMPTLAALLGHSKLNMVMRCAHPQEQHQTDAVKRLELINATKKVAEADKQKKDQNAVVSEIVPTNSPTMTENSANFFNSRHQLNPPNQLRGADRIRTDA